MRVLVIYGKKSMTPSFLLSQLNSLEKKGIDIEYFEFEKGSLRNPYLLIKNLNRLLGISKVFNPDIIHSHYSYFGAIAAIIFRKKKKFTSLMGTDVNSSSILNKLIIEILKKISNHGFIIKSSKLLARTSIKKNFKIIPNGVDTKFLENTSNYSAKRKIILFGGSKLNPIKNYSLFKESIAKVKIGNDYSIKTLENISHSEVMEMLKNTHTLCLTSFSEGSPNIVKEAFLCGCNIVSVNVGDVKDNFEGLDGVFISSSWSTNEFSNLISKSIQLVTENISERIEERKKIISKLGLSLEDTADKLIKFYKYDFE